MVGVRSGARWRRLVRLARRLGRGKLTATSRQGAVKVARRGCAHASDRPSCFVRPAAAPLARGARARRRRRCGRTHPSQRLRWRSGLAGGRLALRVKVRNAGSRPSRATKLRAYLSLDRKRDGRDVALAGTLRVPKLKARAQRTVRATLTVPSAANEGRYRVIVCAGTRCAVSSAAVRVTRRAASPGARGSGGRAAAAPGAEPTPAPRPTTTPTPEPTPVVTPEPEPVDPGLPTDFSDSVSFLYEGANRVQTGVAAGHDRRRPRRRPARQRPFQGGRRARRRQGHGARSPRARHRRSPAPTAVMTWRSTAAAR